jgi:hypothetical protein
MNSTIKRLLVGAIAGLSLSAAMAQQPITLFKRSDMAPAAAARSASQVEAVKALRDANKGTIKNTWAIRMDLDALFKSKSARIELPNGKDLVLTGGISAEVGKAKCWDGSGSGATMRICRSGDYIDGEIHGAGTAFGTRYSIRDNGSVQTLTEGVAGKFKDGLIAPLGAGSAPLRRGDTVEPRKGAASKTSAVDGRVTIQSTGVGAPVKQVRIATIWLSGAAKHALTVGGVPPVAIDLDKLYGLADAYIASTQSALNSSLAVDVKLVNAGISGNPRMDNTAINWDSMNVDQVVDPTTGAPSYNEIKLIRDNLNADLTVFICKCDGLNPQNHVGAALVGGTYDKAFAAVDIRQVMAVPSIYLFQHEVGHLLGGKHSYAHNTDLDTTTTPYPKAHGISTYVGPFAAPNTGDIGCIKDIMSSGGSNTWDNDLGKNCANGDEIWPRFSNPALTWTFGSYSGPNSNATFGDNTYADAAGVMSTVSATVTNFHLTKMVQTTQPQQPNAQVPGTYVRPSTPPASPPATTGTSSAPTGFGLVQYTMLGAFIAWMRLLAGV